jgi:hypothetical protein
MSPTNIVIRDAFTGRDDAAVTRLITDYMQWAHERLARELGVQEPARRPRRNSRPP